MASFVAKFVGKKIMGETLENKFGKEDPYFETVPATRMDGSPSKSGRTKKRKRALPPGLTDHDAQVLTKVKRRAYRLDTALFSLGGIKFGWGSVIGIIPGFGDVLDMLLALMVMKTCQQIEGGLPSAIRTKMMINIIIDFVIGLVPFLGDMADAVFRANTRNAVILEEHLRKQGVANLKKAGQPIPAIDPSSPEEFDKWQKNGGAQDDRSPLPSRQPSKQSARHQGTEPLQPEPAEVRGGSGWRNKTRPADVEMGQVDNGASSGRKKSKRSGRH